ncbi:MAG: hypothetical protein Q7S79_00045, partial [bacterium]|nr:hypothetical protein [bacterium]
MAKQERKTGLQLYTLPIISEPLAEFVYNEFAEDPRSFLITTATHMDASNLDFLDHILQKSFGLISAGQLHEVGLYAFIGASFAYRFFDQ